MTTKEIFYKNFRSLFQIEPTPLVEAQINQLLTVGYSYTDINNALWYVFKKLELKSDIETYGLYYLKQHIEESVLFFEALEAKRQENMQRVKDAEPNPQVKVKRQERKVLEKEYDWNDFE